MLNDANIDNILSCNNVDVAYNYLEEILDGAIKKATSKVKIRRKVNNYWFDFELQKMRNKKERLYNKYIGSPTLLNKNKYNATKNSYEKLIIQKKRSFHQSLIRKFNGNMKKTWGVINRLLGNFKKKDSSKYIRIKGSSCSDPKIIANEFNSFFTSLPKKLHNKLPKITDGIRVKRCLNYLNGHEINETILLRPTSFQEVTKIIKAFRKKSSTGVDNKSPKLLKHFPDKIINCLVHIFNLSLDQGEFISSFKRAKVVPIHKSDDKQDMKNYRPISLLPVASKILEKIMYNRVYSFLDRHSFFYQNQYGFRSSHSTELAGSFLINQICSAIDKNMKVMSVFLDMSKAFDCVDHQILLKKLYRYGIRDKALSWFVSYFSDRTKRVCFNGTLSENICSIKSGVPQGSILGPLLYLIYVNDFHMCLNRSSAILFADDTTLVVASSDYKELYKMVNEDLMNLNKWLCLNKLTINLTKTKYMVYSLNNTSPQPPSNLNIRLNGTKVDRVEVYKFLGVTLDHRLNWKPHMSKILSKIQRNLGIVRKISYFLNRKSLLQLFHSMIMSHIRYGITLWHHGQIAVRKKSKHALINS